MADPPPPPGPRDDDDAQLPPDPLYGAGQGPAPMPQAPIPGGPPGYPVSVSLRSPEERRAIFSQQLQQAAMRQLRVESMTDFQAVLIQGKSVNHVLHAILTIFTCFLWGIVWIILSITGGETRYQLIVDEFGNVHWQNLG
jgi:hypothetical protein